MLVQIFPCNLGVVLSAISCSSICEKAFRWMVATFIVRGSLCLSSEDMSSKSLMYLLRNIAFISVEEDGDVVLVSDVVGVSACWLLEICVMVFIRCLRCCSDSVKFSRSFCISSSVVRVVILFRIFLFLSMMCLICSGLL